MLSPFAEEQMQDKISENTPPPKSIGAQAISLAAEQESQLRDRRALVDGRRGRWLEQTPPGTRTKMIKIIYDHQERFATRRKRFLVWVWTLSLTLTCLFGFGAYASYKWARSSLPVAQSLAWLEQISGSTVSPAKSNATAISATKTVSAPTTERAPARAAKVQKKSDSSPKKSKSALQSRSKKSSPSTK